MPSTPSIEKHALTFLCSNIFDSTAVSDSVILSMASCRYTFNDKWLLRQVSLHLSGNCSHLYVKAV